MSAVANLQVEAEKSRLVEAKRIAESEKGLYVRVSQISFPFLSHLVW